jgi:hypothetical protein
MLQAITLTDKEQIQYYPMSYTSAPLMARWVLKLETQHERHVRFTWM